MTETQHRRIEFEMNFDWPMAREDGTEDDRAQAAACEVAVAHLEHTGIYVAQLGIISHGLDRVGGQGAVYTAVFRADVSFEPLPSGVSASIIGIDGKPFVTGLALPDAMLTSVPTRASTRTDMAIADVIGVNLTP